MSSHSHIDGCCSVSMRAQRQRGAVTVESAITLLVFVTIIFATMEFSIFIYRLSSYSEATRAGARYLIVNEPLIDDFADYTCDSLPGPDSCSGNSRCDGLVAEMRLSVATIQPENIYYQYRCASTGYDESYFQIYTVDVWLDDLAYSFVTPGLSMIEFDMPHFLASRLSEDLDTVE